MEMQLVDERHNPSPTRRYMTFEDVCKRQAEIDARFDELVYKTDLLYARFDQVLDKAEAVLTKMQADGIGGLMRDVMGGTRSRKRSSKTSTKESDNGSDSPQAA